MQTNPVKCELVKNYIEGNQLIFAFQTMLEFLLANFTVVCYLGGCGQKKLLGGSQNRRSNSALQE